MRDAFSIGDKTWKSVMAAGNRYTNISISQMASSPATMRRLRLSGRINGTKWSLATKSGTSDTHSAYKIRAERTDKTRECGAIANSIRLCVRTTGMFPMRKMLSWRCGDVLVYIDILITIGAWIPRVSVAQTRNLGKSCGKVRGAKLRTKDVSLKLIAWSVRFRAASNSSPPC